jgi:murein DD-endopeptidase MepM/ murein hydrolase activator NlpD
VVPYRRFIAACFLLISAAAVSGQPVPASAQDSGLETAVEAALERRSALPRLPDYHEVGRTLDPELGGVIYLELIDRETGSPIDGVIDWLVATRESSVWRALLPGEPGYGAALSAMPADLAEQFDSTPFQPAADPALTDPALLADYHLPWTDGTWGTVTRSYAVHGRGKIDFDLTGLEIAAAQDGVIIYANDRSPFNGTASGAWWYWNVVVIRHGPHAYSLYGHLAPDSIPEWIKAACSSELSGPNCSVAVSDGDVIGLEGNTGHSTRPHLHIEFGQQFGVAAYPDLLDADADGDRAEPVHTAFVFAEHNVAFAGYTPDEVGAWPWGRLEQAGHRLPPPNSISLVSNGDFVRGTEGWTPSGQLSWSVADGMLRVLRLNNRDNPQWASFWQNIGFGAPANTPFEVSLLLGSDSPNEKQISVTLLNAAGRDYGHFTCTFTLAPGSPLRRYHLLGRTNATWADVRLEIGVNPPDGSPAALVDEIAVVYRPDQTIDQIFCTDPE